MSIEKKAPGTSSARKILGILLSYSEDKPQWTAHELSRTLGISMPTMYRYVAMLRDMGLLEPAAESSYRLGEEFVRLARAAQAGRSLLADAAVPVMQRIRDEVNETVLIAARNGNYVYCIERLESRQPVRLQFDRGQPMSLHRGALARVLLAHMPERERNAYIAGVLDQASDKGRQLLTAESLRKVAEDGYTQSFEEIDESIWGTAAASREQGSVRAALGLAAPIYRLDARLCGRSAPCSASDRVRLTRAALLAA